MAKVEQGSDQLISVMLVDDNEAVLSSTSTLLEISGYDVCALNSGEKALALLETGFRPDILISDYRLPGLSGIEIIRMAREKLKKTVPAIIVSGDTSAWEIQQNNLENCAVLQKPYLAKQLTDLISGSSVLDDG
jgi:two-component system CheB/CheR fusion protein